MDTIEQLKTMRDQAQARIEATPDYKLMGKLTTLIEELEQIFAGVDSGASDEATETGTEESDDEESHQSADETDPAAEAAAEIEAVAEARPDTSGDEKRYDPAAANVLAELEKLTSGIEDGEAQHDVEEASASNPLDEVSEEIALEQSDETGFDAGDDMPDGTDSAILQAMAELEADLGNAEIDLEQEIKERRGKN